LNLNGKIIIKESNVELERKILASSQVEIKKIFQRAKVKIHSEIINIVVEALSNCPEILSLKDGKLRFDFGLSEDPTTEIVYAVANSVQVYFRDFNFTKQQVKNIFSIYIQPSDFRNLISSDFANVVTENGEVLPWLKWLLLEGDTILITSYHVAYGSYDSSRSGGAVMLPKGVFRVDPAFSGTDENNFITRAIEQYEDRIFQAIRNSL